MSGPDQLVGVKRTGDRPAKDKESRKRKRHYYGGGANHGAKVAARSVPHASRGFLVSCEPKREVQCYREAYVLFAEQIEALVPELAARLGSDSAIKRPGTTADGEQNREGGDASAETKEGTGIVAEPAADVADAVAAEVAALREAKKGGEGKGCGAVMSRVDLGVNGSMFVRVSEESVPVEKVVSAVFKAARENGTPGCRACIRFLPVHFTCYAKATDAADATAAVVRTKFPTGKAKYAIRFRSRLNSDAHRDDYIKQVAAAVDQAAPGRFKVDLENPDVVLCIEVVKTQCFMGVVPDFDELAKLNIREMANPSEPKAGSSAAKLKPSDATVVAASSSGITDIEPEGSAAGGTCSSTLVNDPSATGEEKSISNGAEKPEKEDKADAPNVSEKDGAVCDSKGDVHASAKAKTAEDPTADSVAPPVEDKAVGK